MARKSDKTGLFGLPPDFVAGALMGSGVTICLTLLLLPSPTGHCQRCEQAKNQEIKQQFGKARPATVIDITDVETTLAKGATTKDAQPD